MREDLYQEMYLEEENYWWHVAKRKTILELLQSFTERKKGYKIADMGCGTGKLMEDLSNNGQVYGYDSSEKALSFCRERGHLLLKKANFSSSLPIQDNFFDIIINADVLEHVQDDMGFLRELYRILRNDGLLVITVPSYRILFSYWDKMLGHKRRYDKRDLIKILSDQGFSIEKISYFNSFILPLAVIFRKMKSLLHKKNIKYSSDFIRIPSVVNNLFLFLSSIERFIIMKTGLPFGLSIICIGKKKEI